MLPRIAALVLAVVLIATALWAADRATPGAGITASRAQIRSTFESRFGLRFSPIPLRDGRPRLLAEDKREMRTIEIIGSEDRVTSVSAIVFSSKITSILIARGSVLATLLDVAAPQWKSGSRWTAGYLAKADDYVEGATQQGALQISLKIARPVGMVMLTIESR